MLANRERTFFNLLPTDVRTDGLTTYGGTNGQSIQCARVGALFYDVLYIRFLMFYVLTHLVPNPLGYDTLDEALDVARTSADPDVEVFTLDENDEIVPFAP